MEIQQIEKLQLMIRGAEFLTEEAKKAFLAKIPYLTENKFQDLYEIFEQDSIKREKLKTRKKEVFLKYKETLNQIYQRAKEKLIAIRDQSIQHKEETELKNLEKKINSIQN